MESYEKFIEYLNTKKRICIVGKGLSSQKLNQDNLSILQIDAHADFKDEFEGKKGII